MLDAEEVKIKTIQRYFRYHSNRKEYFKKNDHRISYSAVLGNRPNYLQAHKANYRLNCSHSKLFGS